MSQQLSLERHHLHHKDGVAYILEKIGLPPHLCLLVGSASIAQNTINQYLQRRPGDLDFYVESQEAWKYLQEHGTEVAGAIGNTVIQIKIKDRNGTEVDVEFFQNLPAFPERRLRGVFKRGEWIHGVLCMSLIDTAIWKYNLKQLTERSSRKKINYQDDMFRALWESMRYALFGVQANLPAGIAHSMIVTGDIKDPRI